MAQDHEGSANVAEVGFSSMMRVVPPYARKSARDAAPNNVERRLQIFGNPALRTIDPARLSLIIAFVEKYLPLTASEQIEYQKRVEKDEAMKTVYMTEYQTEQYKKAIVQGVRESLLRVLEKRFGTVPTEARKRLAAIQSTNELNLLLDNAITASSLNELGLLPS